MSNQVVITDVGPRDGLQNQKKILSISERAEPIYALGRSGIPGIEVGSFVSPRAVPAMAGTDKLVDDLNKTKSFQTPIVALVPNLKGYHMAREAGMRHVVVGPAGRGLGGPRRTTVATTRPRPPPASSRAGSKVQ